MRKAIGLAAATILIQVLSVPASKAIAVGLVVGEPTGFNVKWSTESGRAVDGTIAWSLRGGESLEANLDYVVESRIKSQTPIVLSYGLGVGAGLFEGGWRDDGNIRLGVRVPLGVEVLPGGRLGIFFRLAPGIGFLPDTDFDLSGGAGIRVYL